MKRLQCDLKSDSYVAIFDGASVSRIFGVRAHWEAWIGSHGVWILDDIPSGIMIPTLFSGIPAIHTTENECS